MISLDFAGRDKALKSIFPLLGGYTHTAAPAAPVCAAQSGALEQTEQPDVTQGEWFSPQVLKTLSLTSSSHQ